MIENHNCDGNRCRDPQGEVRVYPLGGGGCLILCLSCAVHENQYRAQRGHETGQPDNWPQVNWFACEVYPAAEENHDQ